MSDKESKRRKILYMITKGNFGGAQRYVFDLASNLPSDKFDVVVAFGEGETLAEKLKDRNVRTIGIPSLRRDINLGKEILAFFQIIKIIKDEKPDILHLNSSKIGGLGALAGRITGVKKIIFTGHGWAFNEERGGLSKIIITILHWVTILLCHKTITVSKKLEAQIGKFPFVKNKIIQIYNGIEEIKFLGKEEARRRIAPNIKFPFWIGTISELHKNKGLDFMIEAFSKICAEFPNTVFVVIGEGEERENIQKLIKKHNLENRVFLLGFIKNAAQYIKMFDIFSLTSRTEAFPYAPLEAGMARLPVIASWAGGIPEMISNTENGLLVRVGETSELSLSLSRLILDNKLRENLGENLSQTVRKMFSFTKMIENTKVLYE